MMDFVSWDDDIPNIGKHMEKTCFNPSEKYKSQLGWFSQYLEK